MGVGSSVSVGETAGDSVATAVGTGEVGVGKDTVAGTVGVSQGSGGALPNITKPKQ